MYGIKGIPFIVEDAVVAPTPWGVAQVGPPRFDGTRWSHSTEPKPALGPFFHDAARVSLHVAGEIEEPQNAQCQLRFSGFSGVRVPVGHKVSRWEVTLRLADGGSPAAHPFFTLQDQGPDGWDVPTSALLPLYEPDDIGPTLADVCFCQALEWAKEAPGYAGRFREKALRAIDAYRERQPHLMTEQGRRVRPSTVFAISWRDGPVVRAGEALFVG